METDYLQENRRLKEVIDTAPFPIGVYTGNELAIELANAQMIQTYGKGNDVLGKSYAALLPELQNQGIFEQLREVLETGVPYHAKNRRVDLVVDGVLTTHYFNYSFTPIFDVSGKIYGVMNTATDVTDLVVARQQALESDEKLRLAIIASELATYETDLITGKISTSENFKQLWGIDGTVSLEALKAKIHSEDQKIRDAAYESIDASGRISYEIRICTDSDTLRWLKVNGKFIFDKEGQKTSLIEIMQDITMQKLSALQLEQLIEDRTAELKRSNEDLLQFAHVISHDLQEPVRKIKVFNSMIESDYADKIEERGQLYLKKVKAATDRMATMIAGVLTYSTINAAGFPAQDVDLNEIIENIKTDLELVIDEKNAELIHGSLPVIEGSPILLHQLFYNLINNALKFSGTDALPQITINSSNNIDDLESVVITVADNGIGFDEKFNVRIFNVFERLHSKEAYEGTGMGLALCKKIAERHNGTLSAVGTLNKGAVFTITLPLRQSTEKL